MHRLLSRLPFWHSLLHPFWRRAPYGLRRHLIWWGSAKFLVGVAAFCLNERQELLLLHHRFHNEYPWGLPGGWLDAGEDPFSGVRREVAEETGLQPTEWALLAVDGDGEWVEVYYRCQVSGQAPSLQESEMLAYRWVDPYDLPLRLTPRQQAALALLRQQLDEEQRRQG